MKETEQAKFFKFVEKQMETNKRIQQTMAEMVHEFALVIRQTTEQMVEQCKTIQETTAQMVRAFHEQIDNAELLTDQVLFRAAAGGVIDVRPFSRDGSPISSPVHMPLSENPPIRLIPLESTSDTKMTSENREKRGDGVLLVSSSDAMATPSLENRKDQGDRSRVDSFSDAKASQISDNPEEEQGDREEFASLVGNTSSRSGTLSRKNSLSENAIAQMKIMAEEVTAEVKQLNLAADSPLSPPPSYRSDSDILSSCLKSSPIAFGTQPFASVDYDETTKEETIKICFSLKGVNDLFQSTPKKINNYIWSMFVQCNKSHDKLLLGLFIKCHGPADGGVGVPAVPVRIRPPVFIVHNWKGKESVLKQANSSMKFEPPYENSGGVWIELDGKQELINKGLITADELNIQVSASLEFHNPGSVTSVDI